MYKTYIAEVIRRGELYIEIERVRQLLVLSEKHRSPDPEKYRARINHLNSLFRALLSAKEARKEVVHNVGNDNGGGTENRGASPTYDPRPSVRVGDILEKEVAGGRK
jgi:hypothetical protein